MDTRFEDYLNKGARKILELFSSPDYDEGERTAIVSAYTNELSENIGDTEQIRDYELLIYTASLQYIDGRLTGILSDNHAPYSLLTYGIKLAERQKKLFVLFGERKWSLPKVENNPERCLAVFSKRQKSISISSKIQDEDRQIDELLSLARKEMSASACAQILALVEELEQDIVVCETQNISLPKINNRNAKATRTRVSEIRRMIERKDAIQQEIVDIGQSISSIDSISSPSLEQCKHVISLCFRQSELFAECGENKWPIPPVGNDDPYRTTQRYQHYMAMLELDSAITQERNAIFNVKQVVKCLEHCYTQQKNLDICDKNGWKKPTLSNNDLSELIKSLQKRQRKEKRKKNFRRTVVVILLAIIAVGGLVYAYRSDKIEIPFDASFVSGQDVEYIYKTLEDAGFTNISIVSDDSGWMKENMVIRVAIDNSEGYAKGTYKKPDVSVVITRSSDDRVYVTDLLVGWKSSDYSVIEACLRNAGFSNISVEEVETFDKAFDGLTAGINLDGESFTNEHCYLSKTAPIIIYRYSLRICIGNSSSEFVGQEYEATVSSLQESGFNNVQSLAINSGFAKGNTVVGVTINNVDTYNSNDAFTPDVKIVVKYSSNDRVDLTSALTNWRTEDYETIAEVLAENGFTNISIVEKETTEADKDRRLQSIAFNDEVFISGECFVQKDTPVILAYYSLRIGIGYEASEFIGKDYNEVVSDLQDRGFTNVQTQEDHSGWAKGNTVVGITVNDENTFNGSEYYLPDTKIVVEYSSDDRIDASAILENWQNKDYEALVNALEEAGIANVSTVETSTTDLQKNRLVKSVKLNNALYSDGACYIQEQAPVVIT